jgi:hypothetical protein
MLGLKILVPLTLAAQIFTPPDPESIVVMAANALTSLLLIYIFALLVWVLFRFAWARLGRALHRPQSSPPSKHSSS